MIHFSFICKHHCFSSTNAKVNHTSWVDLLKHFVDKIIRDAGYHKFFSVEMLIRERTLVLHVVLVNKQSCLLECLCELGQEFYSESDYIFRNSFELRIIIEFEAGCIKGRRAKCWLFVKFFQLINFVHLLKQLLVLVIAHWFDKVKFFN